MCVAHSVLSWFPSYSLGFGIYKCFLLSPFSLPMGRMLAELFRPVLHNLKVQAWKFSAFTLISVILFLFQLISLYLIATIYTFSYISAWIGLIHLGFMGFLVFFRTFSVFFHQGNFHVWKVTGSNLCLLHYLTQCRCEPGALIADSEYQFVSRINCQSLNQCSAITCCLVFLISSLRILFSSFTHLLSSFLLHSLSS